jgi:hypothetical protein
VKIALYDEVCVGSASAIIVRRVVVQASVQTRDVACVGGVWGGGGCVSLHLPCCVCVKTHA